MEFIILISIIVVLIPIMFIVFNVNLREMKKAGENPELDKLSQKFPENKEICQTILKKLNNEKVKIQENEDKQASLYIAMTDTILIANIKNSYTRIQTIAHECLHSIQNRKMLIFNFIYSNIYMLSFIIICVLTLSGVIKDKWLFVAIFIIMSFIYYVVRSFLETDAMTKAEFLAKEYMEEYIASNKQNVVGNEKEQISKQDVEKISNEYKRINIIGIPATQFILFFNCSIKVIIYLVIASLK